MQSTSSDDLRLKPVEMSPVLVRAGAGAGKTTELVRRVLSLAKDFKQKHGKFPSLVVTTFTKKATQELRERLMKKALEMQDVELVDYVQRSHRLHISTIHGILSLFLSRFGSAVHIPPDMQVIEEAQHLRLKKKILRQTIKAQPELSAKILDEIQVSDLEKIIWELEEILADNPELKFLPVDLFKKLNDEKWQNFLKQTAELTEALAQIEDSMAWVQWISQVRQFVAKASDGSFDDSFPFLESFIEELPSPRKSKKSDEDLIERRKQWSTDIKKRAEEKNSEAWRERYGALSAWIQNFYFCFAENLALEKQKTGRISISDLEIYGLKLVREFPDATKIFSLEWNYWLIDEYQDTSPRQVELLKGMVGDRASFVVGDPQQSIYLFRGARTEVFLEQKEQIQHQKGDYIEMMTNYRSEPSLLKYFNFVFKSLGPQFAPMQPGRAASEKSADVVYWDLSGLEEASQISQDPALEFSKSEIQAALIRCQELLQQGVSLEKICILSRRNRDLEEFAIEAYKNSLPVQVHAGGKFYQRREIRDALAILQFLSNPNDNENLVLLLRSPWFHLKDSEIYESIKTAKIQNKSEAGLSLWQTLRKRQTELSAVQELEEALQRCRQVGIGRVFHELVLSCGLLQYAHAIDPSGRRKVNLWKLLYQVAIAARKPGFKYTEIIRTSWDFWDDNDQEADAASIIESRRVNLMTIHASKGLQFEHVILLGTGSWRTPNLRKKVYVDKDHWVMGIPSLEDGKWALPMLLDDKLEEWKSREAQEYDRLLYVALTRAEKGVTLIYSKMEKGSWAERIWRPLSEGSSQAEFGEVKLRKDLPATQKIENTLQPIACENNLSPLKLEDLVLKSKRVSVSQMLMGPKRVEKPTTIDFDFETYVRALEKAQFGVEVHEALELMESKQQFKPSVIKAMSFVAGWNQGLLRDLIRDGEKEWGFIATKQGQGQNFQIQGQIDLWGWDAKNNLWVVDYKTGNRKHMQEAFEQLTIYAWAICKCRRLDQNGDLPKINLAVVYPMEEVVEIKEAPSFERLESFVKSCLENL